MAAQEGTPSLDQAADKSIKTEEQLSVASSSVLRSSDSGTEVREEKTKENPVSLDSSLTEVRTAESSSVSVSKGELETASSDESSTLPAPSSSGSTPYECTEYIREGTVEILAEPKSAVSSVPLANPSETIESGKAKEHSHDSTANTMPSIYAAEVTETEWTKVEQDVPHATDTLPCVGTDRNADRKEVKANVYLVSSSFEEAVQVAPLAIVSSIQSVSVDVSRRAMQESVKRNKDGRNAPITVSSRSATIGTKSSKTTRNEVTQTETGGSRVPPEKGPEVKGIAKGEVEHLSDIHSSNIPETGGSTELSSVSGGNQETNKRTERQISRQDSKEPCRFPGIERYHYVLVAISVLTVILGFICYMLAESGIGPAVFRPIGASTLFISTAACLFLGIYLSYIAHFPDLPMMAPYEMAGDVDLVMAFHRIANPQRFDYNEDDECVSRRRVSRASSERSYRETQFADVSCSTETSQAEGKMRLPSEPGPSGLCRTSERLKTGFDEVTEKTSVPKKDGSIDSGTDITFCDEQDMELSGDSIICADATQSSAGSRDEQASDFQSSDECHVSETTALLSKKDK